MTDDMNIEIQKYDEKGEPELKRQDTVFRQENPNIIGTTSLSFKKRFNDWTGLPRNFTRKNGWAYRKNCKRILIFVVVFALLVILFRFLLKYSNQ